MALSQSEKEKLKKYGLSSLYSPILTPSHSSKKGVVAIREAGKVKILRFGQQGYGHNYSDEARQSFKSRHAKNIAKGPTSAAYWADKVLWGGPGGHTKQPPKSRKNPTLFTQPDLLTQFGDTSKIVPWEEIPLADLKRLPLTAFSLNEMDEMREEDPELFDELFDNEDGENQEKRVENAVAIALEYKNDHLQYALEDYEREWIIDKFQDELQSLPFEDLLDHAEEVIGESLAAYSEDELDDMLREPDLYVMEHEDDSSCNSYMPSSRGVWRICLEESHSSWNPASERDFDEVEKNGLFWGLLPSDARAFEDALRDVGIYLGDAEDLIDPRITDSYEVEVVYSISELFWFTIDRSALADEIETISKGKTRIKRDPSPQNVVWRPPSVSGEDGNYVALLSPENLGYEGRMQRHCVGRPGMGYGRRINNRDIDIYSYRKPNTKAILTIEVELDKNEQPVAVRQVKGFTNRLPGFNPGDHSTIANLQEVADVKKFIEDYLGLDPFSVGDLRPALNAWAKSETVYGRLLPPQPAGMRPNPPIRLTQEDFELAEEQYNKPWGGCWFEDDMELQENPSLHRPRLRPDKWWEPGNLPIPLKRVNFIFPTSLKWFDWSRPSTGSKMIPLGPFFSSDFPLGSLQAPFDADLGVLRHSNDDPSRFSFAVKYGNEDFEYTSGEIEFFLGRIEEARAKGPDELKEILLKRPALVETLDRLDYYLESRGYLEKIDLPHSGAFNSSIEFYNRSHPNKRRKYMKEEITLGSGNYVPELLRTAQLPPRCDVCFSRSGVEEVGFGQLGDPVYTCINCGE
ncbi:hypothetical protein DRH13_00165 [Candidatus Woesebacteria bacterium]|nr:MAG: hypothetical protein DRH13_00165 [Candidatus Woesebacteria bacterium]